MQFSYEKTEDGIKITATTEVGFHLEAPHPHIVHDGVVIPIEIINRDLVRIGNKLIHRSALEEGGWVEHRLHI